MEGRFRRHQAQLSIRVLRFEFRVRFLLSSSSGSSCPPPENFSDRILWSEAGERFHRHLAQFFPRALRCVVLARLEVVFLSADPSDRLPCNEVLSLMHPGRLL